MQKNIYGLLGIGLAAILVGVGLYWHATQAPAPVPAAVPAADASKPAAGSTSAAAPQAAQNTPAKPAPAQPEPAAPVAAQAPAAQARHKVPVFDLLRVEPDGSVVIAGQAEPNADVEVVAGATVLGKTKAGSNGDFAVVLDEALKPGDHQLVLRATGTDNKAATSAQTAIVSVPDTASGQVLALVEEPGQASRLITRPQAAPEAAPQPESQKGGRVLTPAAAPSAGSAAPEAAKNAPIAIEAVEIEGDSVFVAGSAKGGSRVIVHANDILLGSSHVSPAGRFLVQGHQALAVGDYIVRADLLDGANRILATARVPFRREAGENISAVAPAATSAATASASQGADGAPQSPALQKVEGSVIIRRGDNLWTISKRTYGKGTRYTTIYLANRDQIRNPDLIWPGQVCTMPDRPLSDNEVRQHLQKPAQ